jgi:hypothetical protein
MSLGFGPKIYLRGSMPIYSNMVSSAIDHLCGGVLPFWTSFVCLVSYGNALMFGLLEFYLPFCKLEC